MIQWNQKNPQSKQEGVITTLTLTCRPDGTLHMETPTAQGGFSEDFSSANEATRALGGLCEQGIEQASALSAAS